MTEKKRGEDENTKIEISQESCLVEIKNIFHSF